MMESCHYCGMIHATSVICPRIEEIEYYEHGGVKRVKLKDLYSTEIYPPPEWHERHPWCESKTISSPQVECSVHI